MNTGVAVAATPALPWAAQAGLAIVLVFAAAVWIGGLVAIFVVARVAHACLGTAERVVFFRGLGRAYGAVGGLALALALAAGAVLAYRHPWDGWLTAGTVLAAALLAVTAAGVVQARWMTQLRRDALRDPGDTKLAARIRRGARSATALRATISVLSVALLALGVLTVA